MTAIGPNFANEIAAAGLSGLPFTWGPDGVALSDPRLTAEQIAAINAVVAAHDPTKPSPQAQFAAALASGVAVVSTGNPANLNGTYDWSEAGLLKLAALQVSLNAQKNLPAGATTVKLKDMAGAWHTFSEGDITNLDMALRDYVYAWDLYIGGQAANPPATPLTIA